MIHRAFPGGLDALEEYRQEVLDGIKDHWCRDPNDPADQRWEYTYHQRLFAYSVPGLDRTFNQMEQVVAGLKQNPHSRRQQAITWKVWEDQGIHDPACLQSLWFRVLPDEDGVYTLNLNVRFRSRDAYDAAFMNCFALVLLMERVAAQLAEASGREVRLGRYVDESDSYHIYGHRLADFQARFLKQVQARSFEDRTWTLEFAEPMFEEARPGIAEKIRRHDAERNEKS
jgi:thymidylate synthase